MEMEVSNWGLSETPCLSAQAARPPAHVLVLPPSLPFTGLLSYTLFSPRLSQPPARTPFHAPVLQRPHTQHALRLLAALMGLVSGVSSRWWTVNKFKL